MFALFIYPGWCLLLFYLLLAINKVVDRAGNAVGVDLSVTHVYLARHHVTAVINLKVQFVFRPRPLIDCLSFSFSLFLFTSFASLLTANANTYIHTRFQFGAVENGITVTKLMQIFSRQAAMMDALISHFADQMRRRKDGTDVVDNVADDGEFLSLAFIAFWCTIFLPRRTLIYVNCV